MANRKPIVQSSAGAAQPIPDADDLDPNSLGSGSPDAFKALYGDGVYRSALRFSVLGSDVTNDNATPNTIANVTGLSFAVSSGVTYRFKFWITYSSAATTTGSRWSINGPTFSSLAYRVENPAGAVTSRVFNDGLTAYDAPADAAPNSAATTGNIAVIEGIIIPSANGTVIARFASEVSSSAITAKAGLSYVEYQIIS